MFKTLLSNILGGWAPYFMVTLLAACGLFYGLWQISDAQFDKYKADVELAGTKAEAEKKAVEAEHKRVLEEIENDWMAKIGPVKKDAIDAYIARYGHPVACRVPSTTGEVRVPGDAAGPEVLHGAEQERMATDEAFISACAEDALFRFEVRAWIEGNRLKVPDAP